MNVSLAGQAGIVTGAGSGIGAATAMAFAEAGASVGCLDICMSGAERTVAAIEEQGGVAVPVDCDVSDPRAVSAAVRVVAERFGRLDFAHNNAGVTGVHALVEDYPHDVWDQVIAVNLTGVFNCMKYELAEMSRRGRGAVVNTCSSGGVVGMPMSAGYVATKHGVAGLTRAAALEYGERGIRVNAILPGLVETPMGTGQPEDMVEFMRGLHPLRRLGKPEEIAAAVLWLCSDAASFVHGALVPVDGGFIAGVTARPPVAAS